MTWPIRATTWESSVCLPAESLRSGPGSVITTTSITWALARNQRWAMEIVKPQESRLVQPNIIPNIIWYHLIPSSISSWKSWPRITLHGMVPIVCSDCGLRPANRWCSWCSLGIAVVFVEAFHQSWHRIKSQLHADACDRMTVMPYGNAKGCWYPITCFVFGPFRTSGPKLAGFESLQRQTGIGQHQWFPRCYSVVWMTIHASYSSDAEMQEPKIPALLLSPGLTIIMFEIKQVMHWDQNHQLPAIMFSTKANSKLELILSTIIILHIKQAMNWSSCNELLLFSTSCVRPDS